jgi:hypothetical protein
MNDYNDELILNVNWFITVVLINICYALNECFITNISLILNPHICMNLLDKFLWVMGLEH